MGKVDASSSSGDWVGRNWVRLDVGMNCRGSVKVHACFSFRQFRRGQSLSFQCQRHGWRGELFEEVGDPPEKLVERHLGKKALGFPGLT